MALLLTDVLVVLCALGCVSLWRRSRRKLPLPPGPRRLPFIGNLLDMYGKKEWEVARQWGDKYGPIIYAELLGTKFIFLNTYQFAADTLEKGGSNYASRPSNVMSDLERWEKIITVAMPFGTEFKQSRQMLHRYLQPSAVGEFMDFQTLSTHRILAALLETPEKYFDIVRHSAGEAILMMTYGYQVAKHDDPYVHLAEKGVTAYIESQSFFFVDAIPWLQYLPYWFPGTRFKKIVKEGHRLGMNMLHEPYEMVKKNMRDGTAVPSLTSKLIENHTAESGSIANESLIAISAACSYGGGSDTTVSAMSTFLLAMILYPDVQKRAQEEIERAVGRNALPSFSDRSHLPYIDAIIKECMRWQPILPFGIPHAVTEDDEFKGYYMPAGATVLPNIWAISRDPANYDNPEEFIPERWLPKEGKAPPLDIYDMAFGFGRRICPGRYFADNSMFIGMASILAAFNSSKAVDERGQPITPEVDYTTLFLRHPKPFKFSIQPRSNEIIQVIREIEAA